VMRLWPWRVRGERSNVNQPVGVLARLDPPCFFLLSPAHASDVARARHRQTTPPTPAPLPACACSGPSSLRPMMIDVSLPLARTRGFHVALALAFQTYLSFLIMPHTPRMDASRNIARNTILYCTYCMGAKVAIGSISFPICTRTKPKERGPRLGTIGRSNKKEVQEI
jgi:hypothetical protein